VSRGLAALAFAISVAGAARAQLVAEQITAANAGQRAIGGPDAIGGVGDWYLANERVEIVVDDPARRYGKLDHGGRIVDAGLRDRRGEDQFAELFPIVNLDQRVLVGYDAIRAEVDPAGRFARLVVTSPGLRSVPRGGALWIRYEDGTLRNMTAAAGYGAPPGFQGWPCQSISPCGGSASMPSHHGSFDGVIATLVKIVLEPTIAIPLGLVFGLVFGATPKNPRSGLMARSCPRLST